MRGIKGRIVEVIVRYKHIRAQFRLVESAGSCPGLWSRVDILGRNTRPATPYWCSCSASARTPLSIHAHLQLLQLTHPDTVIHQQNGDLIS